MTATAPHRDALVELRDVRVWFPVRKGLTLRRGTPEAVRAVDGVDLDLRAGEVLGLVGESGSGKSTLGRAMLGMVRPTSGQVLFDGMDLSALGKAELRSLRRRMQIVFQNSLRSLSPRMTIGEAVGEPLRIHAGGMSAADREAAVERALEQVGMSPASTFVGRHPHQISGGQQQRVVMARALITNPDLVVADEALASADVSIRVRLIDLMLELKDTFDLTYLFITHDLALARQVCDRIAILYLGRVVEIGDTEQIFATPKHPYTEALLAAVPSRASRGAPPRDKLLSGEIPSARRPPPGCRLHPRCPLAVPGTCDRDEPPLVGVDASGSHRVACHVRAPATGSAPAEPSTQS